MNHYWMMAVFFVLFLAESYFRNSVHQLRKKIYQNQKMFYEYLKAEGKVSLSPLNISLDDDIYLLELMMENRQKEAIPMLMEKYSLSKKEVLDYFLRF